MRTLAMAAALALLAQQAASQEAAEIPGHEGAAWMIAYDMHGGKFTPEQQNELVTLAWHLVVNNLCEDIHVDHLTFGQAVADFEHSDGEEVSDEEHEFFVQHINVNLGVAVGILLAEHADDPEETCSQAMEHINDPEFAHYLEVDDEEP